MNSKIRKLLLIVLLSIISLIIPNSVKADESSIDKSQVEVKYTIKIKKIDTETKELLKGAVFELKDTEGNVVRTASTDENGDLSFGEIKTVGAGIDTYYIKEVSTPEGYGMTEKEDIEVKVIKNIDDEGEYTLQIECETLNYSFDITRYDYIPVSTVEQLKKIGSGEEIEYEGVKYTYSANGNYKLVNDIDLSGIEWTPIDEKIEGIFDGNGHSIKNLTIAKKENGKFEYSEIGLFRYFSGVVENLNLEKVNIIATNIDIDSTTNKPKKSISGKIGVGAFAGFMEKGIVKNCTVSGTIVSYYNNVGGFVGHSEEKNIIKFQDCTSSISLTSAKTTGPDVYNAGGMIGCAVGSVSFEDCTFNGEIQGIGHNVGGLVGFTDSDGYEEYGVKAGYIEEGNEITLLIGNSRIKGKYDLILQNCDVKTLGLISGAKYTVYDSDFNKMKDFENIQLENGELKIENIEIKVVGTDIFYIKEIESAPGYQKLNSYIKLIVTRYWDIKSNSFKVRVDAESIGDSKIEDDKKGSFDGNLDSQTGNSLSTDVKFENVGWNNAKALFINCNNKGNIVGSRDIGGLLGTSYCKVEMNGCKNYGQVVASGSGKAAGLVCKIEKQENENFLVKIENCCNEGEIISTGSTDCASGILGQVIADIEIKNCINKADITGATSCAVSGILADYYGNAEISECVNNGDLYILSSNPGNVNGVVGGILAKNYVPSYGTNNIKEENNINIYNCKNTGNIKSETHCSGILGLSNGNSIIIENCENSENSITGSSSDSGGMVGFASVKSIMIKKCITKNTQFSQNVGGNNTYGLTGGIIGDFTMYNGGQYTYEKTLDIFDCDVLGCLIESTNKETAGIFGGGNVGSNSTNKDSIVIKNCNVEKCTIRNKNGTTTYTGSAGIYGTTYNASNITIKDCNVKKCNISSKIASGSSGGDTNTGGIISTACYTDKIELINNTVEECDISNDSRNQTTTTIGGIIAYEYFNSSSNDVTIIIDNCDVKKSKLYGFAGNIGGTAGMLQYGTVEIKNCDNIENTIYSEASEYSNTDTGGIVAGAYSNIFITDCTVIGTEENKSSIYGRGRNVSGVLAWGMNNVTVNNVTVKNLNIKSDSAKYSNDNNDTTTAVIGYSNGIPKVEKCLVENCIIDGYGGNSAGVLGSCGTYYGTSFKDIIVKNTNISNEMFCARARSNSTTSGLIGYLGSNESSNPVKYENITIDGCNITGHGSNTSGMISVCNGGDFYNCTVKNTNISKYDSSSHQTGNAMAGMISSCNNSNLFMDDCKIENVIIEGDSISQGGFIGYCGGIKEFNNNTVKKLTITGTKGQAQMYNDCNGSIGGIIADLSISDTIKIENCDVTDFIAESEYHNIGGMIGTTYSNLTLSECNLNDLDLEYTNESSINGYYRCVGGMVAISTGKTTIINGTVKGSQFNATTGTNSFSNVGSLIGYAKNNNDKNEINVTINECEINENTISNETSGGMAGGIIGYNYCTNSYDFTNKKYNESHGITKLSNVDVINCEITATAGVGGAIGYGVENIDKVNVKKCKIKNTLENSNGAGGIVGMSLAVSDNEIKNSTVMDSSVTSKSYAGGIAGYASGKIDGCTVTNTSVTTDASNGCVGGIAGFTYDSSSSVNSSTVSNCNISNTCVNDKNSSNYHVGGIVGFTEGNLNEDIVNEKTTVSLEGNNSNNSLGGILGMTSASSGSVNGCDIDDVKVIGKNGFVGGIVGESNKTITDCDVNCSNIKSEGESSHGCGGIVGCGCSDTTIDESSIEDSFVEAHDHVGAVYGMGIVSSSCEVENVTVIENGQSRIETKGTQATGQELESEEIMNDDLSSESNTEIEATKEEETSNTTDSVEENLNPEVDEPKDEMNQDTTEDSNTNDENKDDTEEGQDSDLESKEDETTSDEEVEPNSPDLVEPNQEENTEDESEKSEAGENPKSESSSEQDSESKTEPEENNTTESTEDLQMPNENTEQNLQQENETSGEE